MSAPPGLSPSSLTVVTLGRESHVDPSGTFTTSVYRDGVTLIGAFPPQAKFGLLEIVLPGATASSPHLDVETTAQAMVFLTPSIAVSDPRQAAVTLGVIGSDANVHQLAVALTRAMPAGDPLADARVKSALNAAIPSVLAELAAARRALTVPPDADSGSPAHNSLMSAANHSPSALSQARFVVDQSTTCAGPEIITPIYDDTSATIAATTDGCNASVDLNGPASSSLGLYTETVAWVYEIAELDRSDFSSADALGSSTQAGCATYARTGTINTDGSSPYVQRAVLLPPPSVYDWLTNPVSTAIGAAASAVLQAGYEPSGASLQQSGVYIYRAYSGGGQEVGASRLNPLWLDNSCLTEPASSGGAPNGQADSQAATALNLFTIGLGAISPILDFTSIGDQKCLTDTFTASVTALYKQVASSGNTTNEYWSTLLGDTVPSLFSRLLGCAAQSGAQDWLTNLWELEKATISKALLPANLALAAFNLDTLAEYTHAVESGFFVVGSPWSSTQTGATPAATQAPGRAFLIGTFAGAGAAGVKGDGGPATGAALGHLNDIAIDPAGDVYLFDYDSCVVRKIAASTNAISTVAGNGTCGYSGDGGPATSAELNPRSNGFPEGGGLTVDPSGNLYIADAANNRVREVNATTGTITTVAGGASQPCSAHTDAVGDGCPATEASLFYPHGVALDPPRHRLYIGDGNYNSVRKVDLGTTIITTVAGPDCNFFCGGYNGDNQIASKALLNFPNDVAVDATGNLYIADNLNCRIREVSPATGMIMTVVGSGTCGYSGDSGPAAEAEIHIGSCLGCPEAGRVRIDAAGNLFIADTYNNVIREVDATTHVITTVAGDGTAGYSGDGGAATCAKLSEPTGIAVDANGNLYIADGANNRVRIVYGVANRRSGTLTPTAGSATACSATTPTPSSPTSPIATVTVAPTLAPIETRSSLSDDFTKDSTLNSALWASDTPLLASLARITGNACCPSYVTPQLTFTGAGMQMSGVSGDLQVTGVQSVAALAPPFTVKASVQATVGTGNPITLELVNASLSQYVGFFGHIGGAGANNIGLEESTSYPFSGASGLTVVDSASPNTEYGLTITVDATGNTTASVSDASGNVLGSTPALPLGSGPFYIVLGQFEGEPPSSGPNTAVWSKIVAETGAGSTP